MMPIKDQGFTFIELMIVVSIIGILASIAIPAYQDYVKRSHVFEGINLAVAAKTSIWDYWSTNGVFPGNNSIAGMNNTISGNSVREVSISGNKITITYNTKVINNSTIILKATLAGGAISWDCTEGTLSKKYRPLNCR